MKIVEDIETKQRVNELMVQVMAAELHLTFFASRYGKASNEYEKSLKEFATAWYLLKKNRDSREFVPEVKAS
jgi:hypothetical protein